MRVKFIEEEDHDDAEWESPAIDPDELRTLALENDELNSLLQGLGHRERSTHHLRYCTSGSSISC